MGQGADDADNWAEANDALNGPDGIREMMRGGYRTCRRGHTFYTYQT